MGKKGGGPVQHVTVSTLGNEGRDLRVNSGAARD